MDWQDFAKKNTTRAKRGVEIFFQQTQRGSLVQPNGLFGNFGSKRFGGNFFHFKVLGIDFTIFMGILKRLGVMQAKKKKKKRTPMRTTQPRNVRLKKARLWLETYEGKKLVSAYAKKYRVDLLCAISELRMLGVEITAEYEQAVRRTIEQQLEQRRLKKDGEIQGISECQDWDFAFIAGYTSGGAPYGIRWEDMPLEDEGLI